MSEFPRTRASFLLRLAHHLRTMENLSEDAIAESVRRHLAMLTDPAMQHVKRLRTAHAVAAARDLGFHPPATQPSSISIGQLRALP